MASETNDNLTVIVKPRRYCHAVSLLFSGRHSFRQDSNLLATSSKEASTRGGNEIKGLHACRHVSVMYISVKVVISASWVRRQSQTETQHATLFQFDKAFAQEIKYLYAELDFDLYMCRDKQTRMNEARERYELGQFLRGRNENNAAINGTVGIQFDMEGRKRPQTIDNTKGKVNEGSTSYFSGTGDSARHKEIAKTSYEENEHILRESQIGSSSDSTLERTIPLNNFRVFVDENNNGTHDYSDNFIAEKLQGNLTMTDGTSTEDSVQLHGIEHSNDVSIGNCLRQCAVPAELTVEEYMQICDLRVAAVEDSLRTLAVCDAIIVEEYIDKCQRMQLQDVTIEDYLKHYAISADDMVEQYLELRTVSDDNTVEEYIDECQQMHLQDVAIEDYLRQFAIPDVDMVEKYPRLCERDLSKGVTVDEYLELYTVSDDITVEEYIDECQQMHLQDVAVEDYLRQFAIPDVDMVEKYPRLCERDLSKGVTVDEYLELYTVSDDITVEEYIDECQQMHLQDVAVEDYLRQFAIPDVDMVEKYPRLCERDLSKGVTVDEYLELYNVSDDITVEEYIDECQQMHLQDVAVEDYLRPFALPADDMVEKYPTLCERDFSKGVTVEEYLEFSTVSDDIAIEEYIDICQQMHLQDVAVEDYLRQFAIPDVDMVEKYPRLCERDLSKGVTVDEYLELYTVSDDITVEEYIDICQQMHLQDVAVEDYLRPFALPADDMVEKYPTLCERDLSKGVTVEEYLEFSTVSDDITVEECIDKCQRMQLQDVTVEDYLKQFATLAVIMGEEYLKLCEKGLSKGVTVEEYLELPTVSDDITVEECIDKCQRMHLQDVPVEDYLRQFAIPADNMEEQYLWLCKSGLSQDFTVEEHFKLHTVLDDITAEEDEICEIEKDLRQLTATAHVRLEEYLKKCKSEEAEDVTVEDYMRKLSVPADIGVEDYLRQCRGEQLMDLLDEDFNSWIKFQFDVSQSLTAREILQEHHDDEISRDLKKNEIVIYRNTEADENISLDVTEIQKGNNSSPNDPHENTVGQEQITDSLIIESSLETVSSHDGDGGSLLVSRSKKGRFVIEETIAKDCMDDLKVYLNVWAFDIEDENMKMNAQGVGAQNQCSAGDKVTSTENIVHSIMNCGNKNMKRTVEEDVIDGCQVMEAKGTSVPKIFRSLEKKYCTEMWLILVPYRKITCTQVSILYQDITSCNWHPSGPVESVSDKSGAFKESEVIRYDPVIGISNRLEKKVASIAEAKLSWPQKESNLSARDLFDLACFEEEKTETLARKTESEMIAGQEPTGDVALLTVNSTITIDNVSVDAHDLQHSSADSIKNKSFMLRSKDKLHSVSESKGKGRLKSLEKLKCKHTKSIALPDSLRRTVSSEFIKFKESISGSSESIFQDIEKRSFETLQISPLKFQLGKNMKESNV
eukprot:Seg617.1 transcript_id=Seg617.1/GoldUCD/mRNA.D3Y31 product="hypothetical protein" protein_id=Seg617.1/GoldUCD/D3Y31